LTSSPVFPKGAREGELLESNYVAGCWIIAIRELLAKGHQPEEAGELAVARIFAPPAGEFGSGVDVVGSSQDPEKIANQFAKRLGNVYSETDWGENRPELFKELLRGCSLLFHCYSESPILDQDDLPLEYTYVPGLRAALEKWGGGEVEKITGTPHGLQGVENGKEPEQQEDSRVRLGERENAPAVQEKPSAEREETVQTKSRQQQASSAPLPPRAPEVKAGPRIFEIEPVLLPAFHSQGQTSSWLAVEVFLALLVVGGVKGLLQHRREFGQVHPTGF
jgi:cobaltochelatase CobN